MKVKKILKVILSIQLLTIPLLIIKDGFLCNVGGCGIEGLNNIIVYVIPSIVLTTFILLVIKIYEARNNKKALKSDQKVLHFIIAILVLVTIIYFIYYWFNR